MPSQDFDLTDFLSNPRPKKLSLQVTDPVLVHFIEDYCKKMQKRPRDFMLDRLYEFFDNMGYGASLSRPDR